EHARVTEDSDPDLFWALRGGGGGDFALVTAVEFDLYAERALYGGRLLWPGSKAPEVFAAYRELTAEAPPELSLWLNRVQFPEAPPMVTVDLAHLGTAREAEDLLARLTAIGGVLRDTRAAMSTADLGDITAEPTDPAPAVSRTELLTGLDADTAAILLAEPVEPLITMQVRHLGGALAGDGGGPGGALAEPYLLYLLGPGAGPERTQAVRDKQDAVVAALGDRVSGRKPYTFLAPGERVAQAVSGPALARLRELKRARDPQGVFRANYPVLD
ncbi:MAG: FAD-linked oxidase, partial [Nonomuraea sp.]|nr:FAD-linked oxidase [Nonomuraea sp.]